MFFVYSLPFSPWQNDMYCVYLSRFALLSSQYYNKKTFSLPQKTVLQCFYFVQMYSFILDGACCLYLTLLMWDQCWTGSLHSGDSMEKYGEIIYKAFIRMSTLEGKKQHALILAEAAHQQRHDTHQVCTWNHQSQSIYHTCTLLYCRGILQQIRSAVCGETISVSR